jgi:hypothetical protein
MAVRHVLRNEHGRPLDQYQVKQAQRTLNRWRRKYLLDKTPLRVDGVPGPLTIKAVLGVKWALGYGQDRKPTWTSTTVRRMRHPHSRKYSSARMLATGAKRRAAHRARVRANRTVARVVSGVGTFDGKPVAKAAIPFLEYARRHGWQGHLVSGWRSRSYSRSLCYAMCGAPSCPGRCAGTSSNHVGSTRSRFAIDVSHYSDFGRIISGKTIDGVRIFNALGARDPVHFSPSGN